MATIDQFVLKIVVEGTAAVKQATASIVELNAAATRAGVGLADLAGGAVAMGTAAALSAYKTLQLGDAIADLSTATGVASGTLMSFRASMIENGGKGEDLDKVMLKLSDTLGQAANGNDKTRKTFKDLGVSLGDANGKIRSTQELLPEVVKALGNVGDESKRTAYATELLGKSARGLDFTKLTALDDPKMTAAIDRIGELRSALDLLFNQMSRTSMLRLASVSPWLTSLTNDVTKFVKEFEIAGFEAVANRFQVAWFRLNADIYAAVGFSGVSKELNERADRERKAFNDYRKQIETTAAETDKLAKLYPAPGSKAAEPSKGRGDLSASEAVKDAMAAAAAQLAALKQTTQAQLLYQSQLNATIGMEKTAADNARAHMAIQLQTLNSVAALEKQIGEVKSEDPARGPKIASLRAQIAVQKDFGLQMTILKQQELTANKEIADSVDAITRAYDRLSVIKDLEAISTSNQLRDQVIMGRMTEEQYTRKSELAAVEQANAKKTEAIQRDIDIAIAKGNVDQAESLGYKLLLQERINKADLDNVAIKQQQVDMLRQSTAAGQTEYLDQLARSVDPFKIIQDKNAAVFNNMTSALDKFVETGKLSFGDLAKSIIRDLLKIELRTQATKLFSGLGGFTGLMGLFTGGPGAAGAAVLGGQYGGAANGGPIDGPTLVGERGPEMFIPKSSGTVIPNKDLMGGGTTVTNTTINNHISAVDAQSVAQLFANNRRTLLGVVETARKELPIRQRF